MGVKYLAYGENTYIQSEKKIDRIAKDMVEYPRNVSLSDLRQKSVEVVYFGELRNPPGVPLVDSSFPTIKEDAVQLQRTAEIWGVVEEKRCVDYYETVSCKKRKSNSHNDQGNDYYWSSKRMKSYIVCTYYYHTDFTTKPKSCENNFRDDTHFVAASYNQYSYCSRLSDQPNHYHVTDPNGLAEGFESKCSEWSGVMMFAAPCSGTPCSGQTQVPEYRVGLFTVRDPYLLDKYLADENPVHYPLKFPQKEDGSFRTCPGMCSEGVCDTMVASNKPGGDVCERFEVGPYALGDQKVTWEIWPGQEDIWTCTQQQHQQQQFSFVSISEDESSDSMKSIMDIDYDLVSKGTLTKDICIETYREENEDSLRHMRVICGLLLVFSCVCSFTMFAACFDCFTDMLTFIPELVSEALCCGFTFLSDIIETIECCVDMTVYCMCGSMGFCVGVIFFFFVFAVIYVAARAGSILLLILCTLAFCCVCAGFVSFFQQVQRRKNPDCKPEALLLEENAYYEEPPVQKPYQPNSSPVYQQPARYNPQPPYLSNPQYTPAQVQPESSVPIASAPPLEPYHSYGSPPSYDNAPPTYATAVSAPQGNVPPQGQYTAHYPNNHI